MAKQHSDKTIEKLIEHFSSKEGEGPELTMQEDELAKMVQMSHELFQAHSFPTWKITRMLCRHFQCSTQTAHMAMRDAQIIFGAKSIYNRRYMAALHLDELIADIEKARNAGDTDALLKLHAIKVKVIELLPADAPVRDITPAIINFNVFKKDVATPELPAGESAYDRALRVLGKMNIDKIEILPTDAD